MMISVITIIIFFALIVMTSLSSSILVLSQKTSQPFKDISLDSYNLPPGWMPGGVLIRGQASVRDFSVPAGNSIRVSAPSSSSTTNALPPFFNIANFSTSVHATGFQTSSTWKSIINNAVYTSGSATTDEVTWWTIELYTYHLSGAPTVGFVPNPALSFNEAVQRCVTYSSTHLNPDDEFDKVSVSGLTTSYVDKRSLSSQWLGVVQKKKTESSTDFDYAAVAGPRIGQTFAHSDGSGCDSSTCDWAANEPSASSTTYSGAAVESKTTNNNKWSTAAPTTTHQSWCVDYPVHLWLLCKIDSTKGVDGAACQFNEGELDITTFPLQTTGNNNNPTSTGQQTTEQQTTQQQQQATTSTNAPVATTASNTNNNQQQTTVSTTNAAAPATSTTIMPSTTVTATQQQQQQQSTTIATTTTTSSATTVSNNNGNNNSNAAGDNSGEEEEKGGTSLAARAGIIFGVGIPSVLVVVGGIWYLRKRMLAKKNGGGGGFSSSSSSSSSNKKMQGYNLADADQELVESLFVASV